MLHWQDLLMCRNHIYNTLVHAFTPLAEINPPLHQVRAHARVCVCA